MDLVDLMDTYRTVHPKAAGCIFFSSTHRRFSRINHICLQTVLHECTKMEIISSIFLTTIMGNQKSIKRKIGENQKKKKIMNMNGPLKRNIKEEILEIPRNK